MTQDATSSAYLRVAVLFHRLGPYHFARLKAAAGLVQLLAIEASANDNTYAWDVVKSRDAFHSITLFENLDAGQLTWDEVRTRVEQALNDFQPQVVVVPGWAERWVLTVLQWCLRRRVPTVVMSESTALDAPRQWLKEAVKRRIVSLFDAGLAGGKPQRDYLLQLGLPSSNVFTGYDVVDNDYFVDGAEKVRQNEAALREKYRLPPKYFFASSRFVEKKNLSRLLEAFAAYRDAMEPQLWSLVLAGDGPLRARLNEKCRALGLDEHSVHLPGFIQYDVLPVYYALASGFVHASTTEQWGLVVNEAMASGLPVLVSNRCGCASDLVEENVNGWTFNPYDVSAVTAAMQTLSTLSEDERRAMGQRSRERIAHWSLEAFANGLENAIKSALSQPARLPCVLDRCLLRALMMR